MWLKTSNGDFLVKSAYKESNHDTPTSHNNSVKAKIWKLRIHNRLKKCTFVVCLGERFGARIWRGTRIWGEGFLNYWVWHHRKGKFSITGEIYCWDLYPKNSGSKFPQNTRYFRNHQTRDSEIFRGNYLFNRIFCN